MAANTQRKERRRRPWASLYLKSGAGTSMMDEPTLVFIHGSGDSSLVWKPVIERLPPGRVVALDLPGHGARHDPPGPESMSVDEYAAAVEEDCERLDLRSVYVAGHSLGGAIVLALALRPGSRVRGLALIGTGARLRVAPQLLESARSDPESATRMLDALGVAAGHERLAAEFREQAWATLPGILYRDLAACEAFDMMADLPRISQPAIVIAGEQDRLTPPKYAQFLVDHLPSATLALIPDAGHYLPIEQPGALATTLTSWLAAATPGWPATAR